MSLFGSSQPQQSSTLFGSTTNNQAQKPNLFGSLNTNTGSAFGQPASSSSSAPATQAPSGGSLFDRITPAPAKPTTSLFGASTESPQQSTGSIFGNAGQQNQQQQPQGGGLFGGLGANTQQSSGTNTLGGSTFGSLGTNTQQSSGTNTLGGSTLLGGGSSLFGSNTGQQNQQQSGQQGGSLFGGFGQTTSQQNQPQAGQQQGTSLFGTLGQSTQQQPQSTQQGGLGQSILSPQQNPQPRMLRFPTIFFELFSWLTDTYRTKVGDGPNGTRFPKMAPPIP